MKKKQIKERKINPKEEEWMKLFSEVTGAKFVDVTPEKLPQRNFKGVKALKGRVVNKKKLK